MVGQLGLPPAAHAIALAARFSFAVRGIDPVPRNIERAGEELHEAATRMPELSKLVRFQLGTAESLPVADDSIDLVWRREVIYLITSLDKAFAECRRLLHAARLLRDPERYITQFGQANYDIMLSDCFWHVYRMLRKLSSRVYLLT